MAVSITDATDGVIVLRQFEGWTNTKIDNNFLTEEQAEFVVKDANNNKAVSGSSYISSNGENKYRFLLFAGGNAKLYTFFVEPKGELRNNYLTNMLSNAAVSSSSSIYSKS